MLRGFAFSGSIIFLGVALLLASCADYGDKITRLEGEIFYTDSVSKTEAEALGDWLVTVGYFDTSTRKSVQLSRENDTLHIRFVIKQEYREEPEVVRFMLLTGYASSRLINSGRPVLAHICNDRFSSLRSVPVHIISKGGDLVYSSDISESSATALSAFLNRTAFFNDSSAATVFLDRGMDRYAFRFVSTRGSGDDPALREMATSYARSMSDSVFNGVPVDFYFVDNTLKTQSTPVYFTRN
jgi:hypothetical protein